MQTHTLGKLATSVRQELGMTIIKYHNTDVVLFNDNKIILNCGGWRTQTTRTRMNQASSQFNLGYRVFVKTFNWYVEYDGKCYPFDDKIEIGR